jgi:hypothetical protein
MKIPYDKNFKTFFIFLTVILVIYYSFIYLINPDEFLPRIKPGNWPTRNWIEFSLLVSPPLILAFIFVFTYCWSEIDYDGIKVHRAFGIVTLRKWNKFAYVGPTVIMGYNTHYKVLACSTRLPYKQYKKSESYILSKDSIRFPPSDEIREALRKYCPNFSTEFENP